MQELARAIQSDAVGDRDPPEDDGDTELARAAEAWARHSLRTYTGELLKRALGISAAISDFTAELSRP